jgi:vancomycin resistance protein VanW
MHPSQWPRPEDRGALRMKLGTAYFTLKRYAKWYFSGTKYARTRIPTAEVPNSCRHVVAKHQSLLIRPLRSVDLWLQYNKVQNLRLAIERLDGLLVRPGETLSIWRLVGRPSRRKGYLPGMVLVNGEVRVGYGGGLCQLSNLIYWMTLHTGLTVTERYRHQYDVFPDANRTLPFGSGATIAYNYIDLQIRNETPRTYCLRLSLSETHLLGEWRADAPEPFRYEIFEKNHHITQHFGGKYLRHNEIWRKVWNQEGVLMGEELVAENHAIMMYSPLLPAAQEKDTAPHF